MADVLNVARHRHAQGSWGQSALHVMTGDGDVVLTLCGLDVRAKVLPAVSAANFAKYLSDRPWYKPCLRCQQSLDKKREAE